jgi:hypothetical protein
MQTIALEFRHENGALAANGTDVLTYLDGRWNNASRVDHIWRKIEELRSGPFGSRYRNQHFVGFTRMGVNYSGREPQVEMSDPEPPAWVPRAEGSRF